VREDPWLAERLGHAAVWWEQGDDPRDVAAAARERAPALAQARVPAADGAALGALQDAGFRVVDATVTMAGPAPAPIPSAFEIRDAAPGDAAPLLEIAERHYGVSRFHLDPAIADATAGAIKRAWLQAYFDGARGDRLLSAHRDGRPAGFLALLLRDDGVGIIDLVAVAPELRGGGAGRALVGALAGLTEHVEAGTQLANAGALRFYTGLGFTVAATAYVLHLHA
jgi:ribosomal protein S18 acetylase RimI-like enzyme